MSWAVLLDSMQKSEKMKGHCKLNERRPWLFEARWGDIVLCIVCVIIVRACRVCPMCLAPACNKRTARPNNRVDKQSLFISANVIESYSAVFELFWTVDGWGSEFLCKRYTRSRAPEKGIYCCSFGGADSAEITISCFNLLNWRDVILYILYIFIIVSSFWVRISFKVSFLVRIIFFSQGKG